jgi:hypothetical protein
MSGHCKITVIVLTEANCGRMGGESLSVLGSVNFKSDGKIVWCYDAYHDYRRNIPVFKWSVPSTFS